MRHSAAAEAATIAAHIAWNPAITASYRTVIYAPHALAAVDIDVSSSPLARAAPRARIRGGCSTCRTHSAHALDKQLAPVRSTVAKKHAHAAIANDVRVTQARSLHRSLRPSG